MLRLTGAPAGAASVTIDPGLTLFIYDSPILGSRREFTLSNACGFDHRDPHLVVAVIFDGERAIAELDAPSMLDRLTRQVRLPPVRAVFVPPLDTGTRASELPGNDRFADALVDELMAQVASRAGLPPDPPAAPCRPVQATAGRPRQALPCAAPPSLALSCPCRDRSGGRFRDRRPRAFPMPPVWRVALAASLVTLFGR